VKFPGVNVETLSIGLIAKTLAGADQGLSARTLSGLRYARVYT
jgi:hypothetical protein